MRALLVLIIMVSFVLVLPGCDFTGDKPNQIVTPVSNSSDDTIKQPVANISNMNNEKINGGDIDMLTDDDLNIIYDGVLINSKRPFADIAEDLGIVFDKDYINSKGTIKLKALTSVDGIIYYWCIHHYPSADNDEITFEYVFDESLQESWIVSISLLSGNIKTKRGIKVGDSEEDMINVYGGEIKPGYSNQKAYYYYLHPETEYNNINIVFVADSITGMITEIFIDYAIVETFDRLEIDELGKI